MGRGRFRTWKHPRALSPNPYGSRAVSHVAFLVTRQRALRNGSVMGIASKGASPDERVDPRALSPNPYGSRAVSHVAFLVTRQRALRNGSVMGIASKGASPDERVVVEFGTRGLTSSEVAERVAQGKVNVNTELKTKSVKELVTENTCLSFTLQVASVIAGRTDPNECTPPSRRGLRLACIRVETTERRHRARGCVFERLAKSISPSPHLGIMQSDARH